MAKQKSSSSSSKAAFHGTDDADAAAGVFVPQAPTSKGSMSVTSVSDLEFFEDLVSEPVLVLGMDISHMSRKAQFLFCASGVFGFSLLYGYLQELLSVQLCSRQLGLYLAMVQFTGYTVLSFILRTYVYESQKRQKLSHKNSGIKLSSVAATTAVPFALYLGLSLLRAVDLGMTNLAMQYVNYPAKTLMKSSRIVFTMLFGVLLSKKTYHLVDYMIVFCIVGGLAIFMHADANSSAVFAPTGVIMLTVSLICDGAITNMSENIMNRFGVGQDEFIFRMYSIALIAITGAAVAKGDFSSGMVWILQDGTYAEQQSNVPMDQRTWTVAGKIAVMTLFSTMGFFGSSCSAAITKNFGALSMSLTSTARKATTLFLSFFLFKNECTLEHVTGIVIFMGALTAKSLRRSRKRRRGSTATAAAARNRRMERMRRDGYHQPTMTSVPSFEDSTVASYDVENGTEMRSRHSSTEDNGRPDTPSSKGRLSPTRVRYHIV